MSSVLQRRKNQNYLENGLGPLWFVQQCTLKSLRPNPAMPQPCIMRSYFDFCFWIWGALVIHNISLLFWCGKELYDDPYRDELDWFGCNLWTLNRRFEVIMRGTKYKGLQGFKVQVMKRRIEEIMKETNYKCLQCLFDLWSVAHLAQTDLEKWTLSVKHHS